MQIWLNTKSRVMGIILSQPKFMHCEVTEDKGRGAIVESCGYVYSANLSLE